MITSDAGGDEVGARALIHSETLGNPWTWVFDGDCLMHQLHIMVRDELAECDRMLKESPKGEGED